ncbi:DUF2254 domain-containing protein [Pontibacter actiniarum]|uniref:DUF2254 domain-containing protein n=1 Tax=Pontibacter actiniarum TaxID=323450 RepID=A0A1X9YQM0_9BACT|nr:DUF2254 domain-containing protein [Pontibacter actiniarum]ARS35170.1 hypothetical protein CA264_06780 [Pontibacter actiniarum]
MKIAKAKYSIKKAYMLAINSIAFYPIMIAFTLLAFSWLCTYLDKISVGEAVIRQVPFLRMDNADTVRSLLSSLLTGLISLVTFTFAMVMIVLSQVTSSFSPRLLPDLISKRGSQIVLGTIVGTVGFIIVVLSNVQTMQGGPEVPLLSTVLGMFLGFASLICFIYFIHKISNEIQIGNILNNLYRSTRDVLNREISSGSYEEDWEEDPDAVLVKAWDSGYFDTITEEGIKKASEKKGLQLRILKVQGAYLLKGEPFLKINKPLDKEIQELLEENVLLRHQEIVKENFYYGFKQLTEIAVKGLSPGVNDPGTAIQAIDYLMDLLCRLQELRGQKVARNSKGAPFIVYAPVPFEKTFYLCAASIRAYSTTDVAVQSRLIDLIAKISERDEQNRHKALLEKELDSIEEASGKDLKAQEDKEYLQTLLQHARKKYLT